MGFMRNTLCKLRGHRWHFSVTTYHRRNASPPSGVKMYGPVRNLIDDPDFFQVFRWTCARCGAEDRALNMMEGFGG